MTIDLTCCHVFVEKPLAETVESAERVVETARRTRRKLVIGYILRHHPSWVKFIEVARTLGTPLVFRMNLNQQSNGATWDWHKRLMSSFPPIVDCGVHYVDVMCQMTAARPIRVHALGARLTDEVPVYNYGMTEKYVLREAVRDIVTDTVYRRQKHPFLSPPATLNPNGKLNALVQDSLRGSTMASLPFFDHKNVVALLDRVDTMDEGSQVANDQILMILVSACVLQERFGLSA